jgi:GTP-binding protein
MEIRNIAIIAHVDHGKTSITDALLRQTGAINDSTSTMDSNDLEQERGITIYAKNASMFYKDTKINIVDTPGHADFGSEVERVLRSIDSVLLVVDAQEGPMPQTKFVLKKSLELGLKPLVILNKIDKQASRPKEVIDEILELFMDLGANDDQLDFEIIYSDGKNGLSKFQLEDQSTDMIPLLDSILLNVTPALSKTDMPLKMQCFNLDYDNYLGRLAIARIYEGKLKEKDFLYAIQNNGTIQKRQVAKIFTFDGFVRKEVQTADAGDIVLVAGFPEIFIGDTITENEDSESLPNISVDEPTISLGFMVNDSPFSGKEGKFVTSSQLRERLKKELEINVGVKIDFSKSDQFTVYGRGEMHIAILLENMRREGYEVQVTQPKVILKKIDGKTHEPFEELTIDVPENMSGVVIEKISKRKGIMHEMRTVNDNTRIVFEIPTRGLLGFRTEFIIDTRGEGIMSSRVIGFKKHVGEIKRTEMGSMVSMAEGKALGYALFNLQDRGNLYIEPNTKIYKGMVVGNVSKGLDLEVNPTKGKQLSNMRSSGADESLTLIPPIKLTLERALEIMNEEILEITPQSIRLRKTTLRKS